MVNGDNIRNNRSIHVGLSYNDTMYIIYINLINRNK